jgi:hypothetical protein
MRLSRYIIALLMACSLTPLAIAQSSLDASVDAPHVPRLGDIMNSIQSRHIKLWFAGMARNWELAEYELSQIESGLMEAAVLYKGIPATNVTTMAEPVRSITDAIEAKDSKRFAKAVGELTDGCNACHQSIGRGFIVIQAPTASPFSNQSFAPRARH